MAPLSQRLELFFLAALPALLTLVFMLIYLAPKHVESIRAIMPLLPLLPVFYWGMLHTRAIPYWFMFLIGLVMDAASGAPMGLTSLLYMLFLALVTMQRKMVHKEGFMIKWSYFSILLLALLVLNWLGLAWAYAKTPPVLSAMMQWALTAACYPLAHYAFDFIEQYIHDRRWKILHGR